MNRLALDVQQWAEQQFESCELGDVRRSRRLVKLAASVAARPDGSTPVQTEDWNDCKAAYRLLAQPAVTFAAVAEPHWRRTRHCPPGTYLMIGDTTEIEFGIHRKVSGLSPTGNGGGRGFLLHSALMVDAQSEAICGLAGQVIHHRRPAPQKESKDRCRQRPRESDVWGQVVDLVGPPAEGVRFIHVFDRGADNFEVFGRLLQARGDWVIRASQLKRLMWYQGQAQPLAKILPQLSPMGSYELQWRGIEGTRTAQLEVRAGLIGMPAPKIRSGWVRQQNLGLITMWGVEVREVSPPPGVEPLHWVLFTSLPVDTFAEAWQVIEYYERRFLIEEFHKALKTGCRVEQRYYQTSRQLEAVTGLLSVVAVRLLQMKRIAQQQPNRPANEVVPAQWVQILNAVRRKPVVTVRDFFRALAQLGGFLGRRGDGEPGWMTLWRGFDKLQLLVRGSQLNRTKCG